MSRSSVGDLLLAAGIALAALIYVLDIYPGGRLTALNARMTMNAATPSEQRRRLSYWAGLALGLMVASGWFMF